MTEALAKKKKVRAGHKASATLTVRQIERTVEEEDPDKSKLTLLRLTLKEKLETIKALDAEIVDLLDDETALVDDIKQADGYKETLFSALIKADALLKDAPMAPPTPTPATPPATTATPAAKAKAVRLPKLHLRHFNGDLTKWTSFWQSFEAAVDNNPDLSAIEKFNYLSSLLESTAREAIAGLALTEANYAEAVSTLKKRFGGTQQIVSKHMETLLQVEAVSNSQNVRALRRLFDNISSHIRSLASLKVKEETYGNLLCPVLINKIPSDLQLIVIRKVPEAEWRLKTLMSAIEEEIVSRERLGQSRAPRRSESKAPSTATTLVARESNTVSQTCCYCSEQHRPTDCTAVTQVDSRKQMLRKAGRCFSCLRKGHLSKNCRTTSRCQTCNGKHHTSICTGSTTRDEPSTGAAATAPHVTEPTTSNLNPSAPEFEPKAQVPTLYVDTSKPVLLQTASAVVFNPHDPSTSMKLRIVMDNGSQRSYLTQHARDTLHLRTTDRQRLAIAAFGSERAKPRPCEVVRVAVQTRVGRHKSIDLFVVPHICEPLTQQPINQCFELFPHISGLELADDLQEETRGIDMLLGSDHYWEFVTGEIRRGEGGPVAINTTLGWVLSGPAELTGNQESTVNLITVHTLRVDDGVTNKMLDATLRSFWELESLGIQAGPTEHSVSDQFASSIKMKGNRYEVALPWRDCHDPLPTNYDLSRRRLTGLLRRLKQNPEILKEYDSIIRTQLKEGIVEEVKEDGATPGTVHYLPHHAVVRQDKDTTKVRVVYDASAKSSGPSLNDCLHVGPKFNQRINELLFRFRSYPVALVADIEKAFLMILVSSDDRDVLRFLWVENPFDEKVKLVVLRFTRVVFGISSSPFLLNATIKHHLEAYRSSKPGLVESLSRSTYVDDIIAGADSEEDAFRLYVESKEVLSHGSFNLRKFVSNSPQLQNQIDEREATLMTIDPTKSPPPSVKPSEESFSEVTLPTDLINRPGEHKVLGVRWDVKNDQLVFDLRSLAEKAARLQPTKRNVVSVIGQIYDPLGYLAPVTVTFKILMQEVCKTKVAWDQPLAGGPLSKWKGLIDALRCSGPLRLPRHYFNGLPVDSTNKVQLYGFCDASSAAYAAVVYIVESSNGRKTPSFVVSKTRVSPLKVQTIPRLELLSALLLARLITSVVESLTPRYELPPPVCFTDSQVALCWIRGVDKDWKPFVQNRVEEIRRLVPAQFWNHCPGKENPADIPSRGLDPTELSLSKLWRNGPDWLGPNIDCCPSMSDYDIPEQCKVELKAGSRPELPHTLLAHQTIGSGLINCERFSSTHKLYCVTAYVLKFIQLLKKQATSPELTQQDLKLAEELWIRESQVAIVQDKRFPTWRMQFGLFQDERKLWRCGGRIQNANLPYSAKHPILLNKRHHLTDLIIREAHCRVHHNGIRETLTEVRSKFWIIGGRSLIRSIIHSCAVCKRFEGRPIQAPPQPPLPDFRVRESPPFLYTGVDFAGPLYLRGKEANDSTKVWICLFTCCVSRAVHLELVFDMSAATFVRCVKRFAARRGLPKRFLSDNAKTFKSAAKMLKTICEHPDARSYFSLTGIEWSFNLEKAPWWGGLFERMVQSTKRCLRKVVGRARFSYDEMHTAIVEIEAIVNSRPLSYIHPDDLEQPLTPSHLLVGRRLLSLPDHLAYFEPEDDEDFELTAESLHKRAKHLSSVLNHFWKRWSREYLLELRDAHRQRNSKKPKNSLEAGDIVLVHDQDQPRGLWKMARVQNLITGRDGSVRGAVLRVASKSGPPTTLQRPLQLLYPLEISSDPPLTDVTESEGESSDEQVNPPEASAQEEEQPTRSRPQREAAVKGRRLVKQWCAAEDLIDHMHS